MDETTRPLPPAVIRLAFPCQRIFYVRALRRMSISALAEACGLTTRDIERIEQSNPHSLTLMELLDVAQGLDAHPAWLAYGVGEMGPYPFDRRASWPDPLPVPTESAEPDPAHDVLRHCLLHHPLPWRVERDYAHEVTALDGAVLAKCRTAERAQAIIALAERIRAQMDADAAACECDLADLGRATK